MSSVSTKRLGSRKTAKRPHPYDNSQRTKSRKASSIAPPVPTRAQCKEPSTLSFSTSYSSLSDSSSPGASTSSLLPPAPAPGPPPTRPMVTIRELFRQLVRKQFPSYVPRNDWELLHLSDGNYHGDESGLHEYLDASLAASVADLGSYEGVMKNATTILDELVDCTGLKPNPGDPQVFVQAIPGCQYSIRLFPGNLESSEYCLDFVHSRTGEPVNSPIKFDLLCVPDPNAPIGSGPIVRMRPLECAFGIPENKIKAGEEKFLLRDGQHCVLRRPGFRDVRFTVPIRRRPQKVLPAADADFLSFPKYID
ncbi:hypothetical protein C8Q79DRAFT_1012954 [Trametes meyenii]|nr:hypothetical protein C8Q79DRAFT_1012954 [Trametes meyenii]